jgi:LytS/YehU family sensor histidine kinase
VIRGFIGWYGDVKVKEDLLRKNHEVELALVRSRLDPHFLFNTLNNIDVLITKDPSRASTYLKELSELMRFVLYGSRQETIPLAEELGFIEKYIRLEQIRVARAGFIVHQVEGSPGAIQIAPMSFIPFIENAFKHSAGQREDGTIACRVVIEAGRVRFECRNRYGAMSNGAAAGGLGNDLIRRRLELLYPGRHSLEVSDRDHLYSVALSLDLDDHLHRS